MQWSICDRNSLFRETQLAEFWNSDFFPRAVRLLRFPIITYSFIYAFFLYCIKFLHLFFFFFSIHKLVVLNYKKKRKKETLLCSHIEHWLLWIMPSAQNSFHTTVYHKFYTQSLGDRGWYLFVCDGRHLDVTARCWAQVREERQVRHRCPANSPGGAYKCHRLRSKNKNAAKSRKGCFI